LSGAPDIAMMRAELRRVQSRLARIDANLAQLERTEPASSSRPRAERYYELLLSIYEHGRHGVDAAQLGALGATYDYDRRGLGGFFAGRRAPLRMTGDRVHLTPEGERLLERHLQDQTS
jgi:lysophospholipase L1-like esterase